MATFALDYDGTFTADPQLWLDFIRNAQSRGHQVVCVTMRYPNQLTEDVFSSELLRLVKVYPTSHKAKKKFMRMQGVHIDIWIDDQPDFLYEDAKM